MKRLMVSIFAIAFLFGCTSYPDIVATNPTGIASFCEVNEQNQLVIHVKNQGSVDAGASTTQVRFGNYGTQDIVTPALKAGDEVTLPPITFPDGCFDSDCGFNIKVDVFSDIDEGSREDNNEQVGNCVG